MKLCLCVCESMCECLGGGDADRLKGPAASQEEPNHQSEAQKNPTEKCLRWVKGDFNNC